MKLWAKMPYLQSWFPLPLKNKPRFCFSFVNKQSRLKTSNLNSACHNFSTVVIKKLNQILDNNIWWCYEGEEFFFRLFFFLCIEKSNIFATVTPSLLPWLPGCKSNFELNWHWLSGRGCMHLRKKICLCLYVFSPCSAAVMSCSNFSFLWPSCSIQSSMVSLLISFITFTVLTDSKMSYMSHYSKSTNTTPPQVKFNMYGKRQHLTWSGQHGDSGPLPVCHCRDCSQCHAEWPH